MQYDNQAAVRAHVRTLSDDELVRINQQGIAERVNGGPADLDFARSDFLLDLFATERATRAILRAFPGAVFVHDNESEAA